MENETKQKKLSLLEKIGYGMGALSESNMQNSLPNMTMPIMNILMGLDPALLATVMAVTRIFDSVSDPLMGYISDNTKSRWGKRKPYILAGSISAALVFFLIWCFPRTGWSMTGYFIYFLVGSIIYFACTTIYCVPYISYGYELSDDYNERTQLMGFRSFFVSAGSVMIPWMLYFSLHKVFPDQLTGMRVVALAMGLIFIIFALGPLLLTQKRNNIMTQPLKNERKKIKLSDFLSVFNLKPFIMILFSLLAGVFGLVSIGGLGLYVGIYYICNGNITEGSYYAGVGGIIGGILNVALLPVITFLAKKFEKRNALIGIFLFSAFGALAGLVFIQRGCPVLGLFAGLFYTPAMVALWMLLMSMTADVCEYDHFKNGIRREGILAAIFSWTGKVGITLGVFVSGFVLKFSGFDQALGANQIPEALERMRYLQIFGIFGTFILAAAPLFFYTLSKEKLEKIKQLLLEQTIK